MNGKRPRIVIVDSLDGLPADIEWVAVDFPNVTSKEQAEAMARHQRWVDDAIWRATSVPPEHFNCRSRMDPRYGDGTAWTPPAQEIITDPNDRRGMDARQIGPR